MERGWSTHGQVRYVEYNVLRSTSFRTKRGMVDTLETRAKDYRNSGTKEVDVLPLLLSSEYLDNRSYLTVLTDTIYELFTINKTSIF